MASLGITATIHRACISHHTTKKPSSQARPPRFFITNQATDVVTPNVKLPDKSPLVTSANPLEDRDETVNSKNSDEQSRPRFSDERWKNGSWDLNMFVKQGRMDWETVIVAEAGRRKHLEMHPEASTNDEPVEFRSSIIPWWAWIVHSHRPEAELLNGRAAMVGFFMAYLVDALTGLDMVGQTGRNIRKYLEMHPEASTNDEPVEFRSSIIPWWAWNVHSHRPEAELLNGRAAMVGFFMAYFVDALMGLDMVGKTGNFVCKAVLFTIVAVLLFRRKEDVENIRKLADEATFYDKLLGKIMIL